ncbi:serine hydrolase domain-containing protein [Paraglaciecola sp.]|uniref:serine hydrolase domain-containing protein n=1 Tax=Paraglaciecola sp. TaxID=1920173 RepID=UPI003EF9DC7C
MKKGLSIKGVFLGLLVTFLIIALVYQKNLVRLYTAVTLYDQDKIVQNFLSMYQTFNATYLSEAEHKYTFPRDIQPLPITFEFQQSNLSLNSFITDSQTTGLLVIKNGNIVFEDYWLGHSEEKQHISFSVAKSFVSALVGIAVADGSIKSIQQAITDYVPELKGTGYDGVRIKDILQMSSGVKFNEDYADFYSDINRFSRATAFGTSLDDFSGSLEREREPGSFHHYVSIDTQVLGMLLTRATQTSLTEYLNEKLWQPLGMEYPGYWLADDTNMELALGGLNLTLRDYAKLGWLYLNKGRWQTHNGQVLQLVPEQWVVDSTTPDAPHLLSGKGNPLSSSPLGYGYQWWIPLSAEDEFAAQGIYDQFIYIDPDQNLVIVKNSANYRYNDKSLLWKEKHYAMFRAISLHFAN